MKHVLLLLLSSFIVIPCYSSENDSPVEPTYYRSEEEHHHRYHNKAERERIAQRRCARGEIHPKCKRRIERLGADNRKETCIRHRIRSNRLRCIETQAKTEEEEKE